jgi:hypothetical protein
MNSNREGGGKRERKKRIEPDEAVWEVFRKKIITLSFYYDYIFMLS